MAQQLSFVLQQDGRYAAQFQSTGEETHIYVNRVKAGLFAVGSTPDDQNFRTCYDIIADNGKKDIHVKVRYVSGVTVVIVSDTEVQANCVIITESPAPLIDNDEV